MRTSPFHRGAPRRAALLGALALLAPAVAVASTSAATAGLVAGTSSTASPAAAVVRELPTSWPAVPVEERLQPWLAGQLDSGTSDPLRVMVSGETTDAAVAAVAASGLTAQQTWDKVGIVVAVGTPDQVRAVVGQPGVTAVEGDQPQEYYLDTAHKATRSDLALGTYKASDGSRVDGTGVTIAVIDSGIDGTHPFFADENGETKVVQNRKNVCGITFEPSLNEDCFQQALNNDTDTPSVGGHGTHVAGIAAGYEVTTSSPSEVALRGSAPGAKLVGLSVGAAIGLLDANSAINWVVEHQQNPCRTAAEQTENEVDADCPPIRATNHSYGPPTDEEDGSSFEDASATTVRLQRMLVEQGVTPVWAAGNSDGDGSVSRTNPPAMDPTPGILMVASYNDGGTGNRDNVLSEFSSRGRDGETQTYPDVSAPGDAITSSCRPTLTVCTGAPSYDGGNYQTISGTSMATPYTAGVVAQLAQVNPAITPGAVEDLLEDNAHKFATGAAYEPDPLNQDDITSYDKGHGLVDVAATLADQQGLARPEAYTPTCTESSPAATDPEGDATQFIIVDTPGPSQPDLDLRKAFLSWDGTKEELTFHITVTQLGGTDGDEFFRFFVNRGDDAQVFAVANRTAAGETFSLAQPDGERTELTGTFDEETNEITIILPAEQYGEVIADETIAEGDVIAVGQVLGQRDTGTITATADSAEGECPFTVRDTSDSPEGGSSGPDTPPRVDPSPSSEPQPSEAPEPGASESPEPSSSPEPSGSSSPSPSGSSSPEPSGSSSPSPSGSSSPSPSGSSSPSPSPSSSPSPSGSSDDDQVRARAIDDACPDGKVPDSGRTDADGNVHEKAIDCIIWWEISRGTSSTQYDPEFPVTREQMASFIARLILETGGELPDNPPDHFTDEGSGQHDRNIDRLAEVRIVDGKPDGSYRPAETVTRAQMAKFLVRAYEHVSDKSLSSSRDAFPDDERSVHEDNINKAAGAGFAAGRANGDYDPEDDVLRDQMASFLARVLDLLVEEGTTPPNE